MPTVHSMFLALCFAVSLVHGQPDITCLRVCPTMSVCVVDPITGDESCEGVEFTTSTPAPIDPMPVTPAPIDPVVPDTTTDMPMFSSTDSVSEDSGSSDSDSMEFSSTDSASDDSGDSDSDDSGDSDDDMDTDYDSESDADRTDDSDDATMTLTNDDDDADTDSDSADSDSGDSSEMPMTTEDATDTTEPGTTGMDSADPAIRFAADDANNADDADADSDGSDMEMSTTDSSEDDGDDDSQSDDSSSDSDSADSDDFSSTAMSAECVTRGLCPDGQVCVINDMGEEECKEAQNAYSANESSTGEMDATATRDVVVSVVGAVGLLGLMAVAIALCCYCGRCASKEGAGSIDLGLTMAEIECEDSASKGRTTNKETAKYGMVTQMEMDGEEELMSDHDEDLIGNHSEMIQLAMPARQTAGNVTGHAMEEEL